MGGDDREGVATGEAGLSQAVGVQAVALGAHDGDGDVDEGHARHGEGAGAHGVGAHGGGVGHVFGADGLHDDDAERKRREGVERVIALQEAGEERPVGIGARDGDARDGLQGVDERRHKNDAQQYQEERVEELAQHVHDFGGLEREEQHKKEKRE